MLLDSSMIDGIEKVPGAPQFILYKCYYGNLWISSLYPSGITCGHEHRSAAIPFNL